MKRSLRVAGGLSPSCRLRASTSDVVRLLEGGRLVLPLVARQVLVSLPSMVVPLPASLQVDSSSGRWLRVAVLLLQIVYGRSD